MLILANIIPKLILILYCLVYYIPTEKFRDKDKMKKFHCFRKFMKVKMN